MRQGSNAEMAQRGDASDHRSPGWPVNGGPQTARPEETPEMTDYDDETARHATANLAALNRAKALAGEVGRRRRQPRRTRRAQDRPRRPRRGRHRRPGVR